MKLTKVNKDKDEICFDIENKLNEKLKLIIELTDGKNKGYKYSGDVLENNTTEFCINVLSLDTLEYFSAEFHIYDQSNNLITEFPVHRLELK